MSPHEQASLCPCKLWGRGGESQSTSNMQGSWRKLSFQERNLLLLFCQQSIAELILSFQDGVKLNKNVKENGQEQEQAKKYVAKKIAKEGKRG